MRVADLIKTHHFIAVVLQHNPPSLIFLQFSAVEHYDHARSQAPKLLDTYVTGGIRLALIMVTRIPPMISIAPTKHEPHYTTLKHCDESEITEQSILVPLRPILYFSYEGEVAVEGEVTISTFQVGPGRQGSGNDDGDIATGNYIS